MKFLHDILIHCIAGGIARNYFTITLKSVGIKDPTHISKVYFELC